MSKYFLSGFLILFGIGILMGGLGIPEWVTGLLGLVAGVLILIDR